MENLADNFLYHYTTIEKLALILKNKTIRLMPLDKLDDVQEAKTKDFKNLGRYIFVSSWTEDETESIPMWNLYSDLSCGVRIGLKRNPFKWHTTKGRDLVRPDLKAADEATLKNEMKTFLDLAPLILNDIISPQAINGDILKKVEYTEDLEKLIPQIIEQEEKGVSLCFGKLGNVKNQYWEFQKEWRYVLQFFRAPISDLQNVQEKLVNEFNKIIAGKDERIFDYYDLEIDEDAFAEMIITPSPKITPGNKLLLESIIEKYNPEAKIIESQLTNLL